MNGRQTLRIGNLGLTGMANNLLFHRQFNGVGELVAIGAEEFDAVVLPWIVRGGNHDAGLEAMRRCEKSDGWSGNDAGALRFYASLAQSLGESLGDPGA